ncbi:MAG: hypothetical protein GY714_25800, partial [Desulfobacterales bacterium]|nr:hypothetical protein [Desulfobacterales bacterium]
MLKRMFTLADHIDIIKQDTAKELLSDDAFSTIREFAGLFPYDLSRDIGFESHLSLNKAFVDLLFCVEKGSNGAFILAGEKAVSVSAVLTDLAPWKNIRKFCEVWNKKESIFNKYIDVIWLEFDYDGAQLSKIPRLFFQISIGQCPDDKKKDEQFLIEILEDISKIFYNGPVPLPLKEKLNKCILSLPPNGEIWHLGLLLTDDFHILRLIVVKFLLNEMLDWLNRIDYIGNFNNFYRSFNKIFQNFDYHDYNVYIDKSGSVLSNVGIEYNFNKYKQPAEEPGWEENMMWLADKGICLPGKINGLLEFSGRKRISGFFDLYYLNYVNHIKLSTNNKSEIIVKGYFGTLIREADSL